MTYTVEIQIIYEKIGIARYTLNKSLSNYILFLLGFKLHACSDQRSWGPLKPYSCVHIM